MAIEKALYQAPEGITEDMMEPAIEIEIEDPESVTIGMGGLEIEISHDEENDKFNENLAEKMEEDEMVGLATDLIGDYHDDISSRKDWVQTYVDGLELLGLKIEERTEPWPGACGVYHPLLTEALVKFQSETIIETFPAQGPVRVKILGEETIEKIDAAQRVKDDMNFSIIVS